MLFRPTIIEPRTEVTVLEDELNEVYEVALTRARELGLPVITDFGLVPDDDRATTLENRDAAAFVEFCGTIGAHHAYLTASRFRFQEAFEGTVLVHLPPALRFTATHPYATLRDELMELEDFTVREGQVFRIEGFAHDAGVPIIWSQRAAWHEHFVSTVKTVLDRAGGRQQAEFASRKQRIQELCVEMEQHPRFAGLKSELQRKVILELVCNEDLTLRPSVWRCWKDRDAYRRAMGTEPPDDFATASNVLLEHGDMDMRAIRPEPSND